MNCELGYMFANSLIYINMKAKHLRPNVYTHIFKAAYPSGSQWALEPIPAVIGQKAVNTLDRL